jgi:hypothetical protein
MSPTLDKLIIPSQPPARCDKIGDGGVGDMEKITARRRFKVGMRIRYAHRDSENFFTSSQPVQQFAPTIPSVYE